MPEAELSEFDKATPDIQAKAFGPEREK